MIELESIGSAVSSSLTVIRRHGLRAVIAALALSAICLAVPASATASTSANCEDPTPYKWLPAGGGAAPAFDAVALAGAAEVKATYDQNHPEQLADIARAQSVSPNSAVKLGRMGSQAMPPTKSAVSMQQACGSQGATQGSLWQQFSGSLVKSAAAAATISYGSGYAWLNNLNQQGQINGYYCGPATVSESSVTENVPVSQSAAGAYMGTNADTGTDTGAMTSGMQYFIGSPVKGWPWYAWVSVNYTPTSDDYANFWSHLQSDIYAAMPVAGNAWEVAGYAHLVGHPMDQTIFHYIEIGGWYSQNGH